MRRIGALFLVVASLLVPRAVAARAPRAPSRGGTLFVSDVGGISADELLTLTALQGIVNRDGPRIYLEGRDETAATWLAGGQVPLVTETVPPDELLTHFRAQVHGLVVWDPALQVDTQDVATTVAGREDLLPVSPEMVVTMTAPPYSLPVKLDLRDEHFGSRAQAYEWALARYGAASFDALAWHGGDRHGLRDLLVQKKVFVFQANPETDAAMVARLLAAFGPMKPIYGYVCLDDQLSASSGVPACEPAGVSELSAAGDYLVPTDLAWNLSVHGWFAAQQPSPPWDETAPAPAPEAAKTYVTFLVSDGDNVGYNEEYLRSHQWVDPARGSIPLGFSISPWLRQLAPRLYDYYVHSLRPDEVLVGGPSGAGYMYPSLDPALDDYLANSRKLLDDAGLRTTWILDNAYAASPSPVTTLRYVEALNPAAIFTDYFGWIVPNPPAVYYAGQVPVLHALWGGSPTPNNDVVTATAYKIRFAAASFPGRPAFVVVALNTWEMGATQALAVMGQLGSLYVAVRPDTFVGLLKQALPPPPQTR